MTSYKMMVHVILSYPPEFHPEGILLQLMNS